MGLAEGSSDFFDNDKKPPKHKNQHTTADAQQEHISQVHHQGSGSDQPYGVTGSYQNSAAQVLARQRFLRALGFNIVVDGVWGPASQSAWSAYLRQRGVSSGAAVDVNRDTQLLRQLNRRRAAAQARTASQLAATQARLLAARRNIQHLHDVERQRPLTYRAAGAQQGLPNPEVERIIREQAREARIYTPDARTIAAGQVLRLSQLLGDKRTRQRTLAGMSAANLRSVLFDPEFGHFSTASPAYVRIVQGYLRAHGHEGVREDGIFDQRTLDGLVSEMQKLAHEEYRQQVSQIRDLFFDPLQPLDLSGLPGFRGKDDPTPAELLARLQKRDPVAARLLAEVYRRLSVSELAQIRAKYLHSNIQAKREAEMGLMLQQQVERDAQRGSFLGVVTRPFEWASDAVQSTGIQIWNDLRDPKGIFTEDVEDRIRRADAELGVWQYEHPYASIAVSLLADPTIFIPGRWFAAPFLFAGRGAATSARFLEEAGFRLSSTGRITRLPALTLTVPARAGRLPLKAIHEIERASLHPEDVGIGAQLANRMLTEVRHATRLLGETRKAAHLRTLAVLRQGFNLSIGGVRDGSVKGLKAPREIADRYDESFLASIKNVDAPAPDVVRSLVDLRQSVYSVLDGDDLTHVGAILEANIESSIRMDAVLQLAERYADQAGSALRSRSEHVLAESEAYRVFEETIERAGPYVLGHGDPELTAILDPLVQHRIQAIKTLYLPAIQKRVELELDALGESLWDEVGHFLPKNDVGDIMRKLGADAYDDSKLFDVPNPLFGRYFHHRDAVEFAAREFRIRLGAKKAWFSRMRAAGADIPEGWLERQSDALHAELSSAWQEVKSGPQRGMWTDVRKELRVPEFYVRQYERVRKLKPRAVLGGEDSFRFSDLARRPRQRGRGMDADVGFYNLQEQVDSIASAFRFSRPEGDDLLDLDLGDPVFELGKRPLERQASARQDFQDAFSVFERDHKAAYDATNPQALAREGALYSALRGSQHAPVRFLFNRMEGWLGMWRFMALPLRSGWGSVNYIDNTVKAFLQGTVNPKYWYRALEGGGERALGEAEAAVSVFQVGWSEIRHITGFFDRIFGTGMTSTLDEAFERFWQLPREIHKRVFHLEGFEFPEEMLVRAQFQNEIQKGLRTAEQIAEGAPKLTILPKRLEPLEAKLASFRQSVWDLFGNRPENFAKRAVYGRALEKARRDGKGLLEAHLEAWAKVDETLFDYSKISTFEDNVRFILPFIQWARKNNQFWLKQAARRPGLSLGVIDSYGDFRAQLNEDLPEWAQRYMALRWASDTVSRVPGLSWLVGPLADSVTDPINLLSVKNLYRMFRGENPTMPTDRAGNAFIDGFVSGLEDFGFSMNPLVRKPLELFGALDLRTWQTVFPQTSLVEAFTRKFWSDRFPNGLNLERMLEDQVLGLMGQEKTAAAAAANFDTYVRMEMAAQAARGEQLDKTAAEEKIRDWLLVQAAIGYFMGIYLRRLSPEDIYYSQIADELRKNEIGWMDMSDEERANYRLWQKRKDQVQFDHYVELLPLVRTFYAIPDYVSAREFLHEHPEVMPFVEESFRTYSNGGGNPGYVVQKLLMEQTDLARSLWSLEDTLDIPKDVAALADRLLVTPELRRFWALNDTAKDVRDRMVRAQYFRHVKSLNDAYHAIPEKDFDARRGFLADHPELQRSWNLNNSNSDDFKVIINGVQADLRDRYFEFADAGDWDGAASFLSAFPFTFDHFDNKGKFVEDRTTGRPNQTQHSLDFQKAHQWLDLYFSMAESARSGWLNSDAEGASIVRWYFDKYGSSRGGAQGGLTQHAQDYLAVKSWLDYYFALSKPKRSAWLDGGSSGAAAVLDYFKKYGTAHHFERSFSAAGDAMLATQNAELRSRILFWMRYFSLTPDKRPLFVLRHAEQAGIFVYGMFGSKEMHDREMAWMRQAMAAGLTARAAAYLFVKPLLDLYFTLGKDERRLFLRANPEVTWYFENFADRKSLTGDPATDKLIERYFRLPDDSLARSVFLRDHPEVQAYFDEKASPAERAMRSILNVYFEITDPNRRKEFLRKHPEIQAYFDKRQQERDNEKVQLEAFDDADPRLTDFFAQGAASILPAAQHMRTRLAFGASIGLGLSTRGVAPSDS